MNRDSMRKLMDLIDDPEYKETMSRVEENLDRVRRAKDQRQKPYTERTRVKNLLSDLEEPVKEKAQAASGGIALILSGGGARGSYQAGAIRALYKEGLLEETQITGVAGTSAGALNAAMLSGGGPDLLEKMWTELDGSRIAGEDGFFSISEDNDIYLKELILGSGALSGINMDSLLTVVTAFDTDSGWPIDFILNTLPDDEKVLRLLASAALPIALKEQIIEGKTFIDGGIPIFGSNVPIAPLYHLGFRRFIVLHTSSKRDSSDWADLGRLGISVKEEEYFNKAAFVHLYASKDLGGLLEGCSNFSHDYIMKCMDLGYKDMMDHKEDLKVLEEPLGDLDEVHVLDGEKYRTYQDLLEDLNH